MVKPVRVTKEGYSIFTQDEEPRELTQFSRTDFDYDDNGFLLEQHNYYVSNKYLINSYSPDLYGNIKSVNENGITTSFTFDPNYHTFPITTTDGNNNTTSFKYDNYCRLEATTDIWGNKTIVNYDDFGRIKSEKCVDNNNETTVYSEKKYTYTNYSLTILPSTALPIPMSVKTELKDSENGYLESVVYYDGLGRTIQTRLEELNGNFRVTDNYNDDYGRPSKTSVPYIDFGSAYTAPRESVKHTSIDYDNMGRISKEINTDGTFRRIIYKS